MIGLLSVQKQITYPLKQVNLLYYQSMVQSKSLTRKKRISIKIWIRVEKQIGNVQKKEKKTELRVFLDWQFIQIFFFDIRLFLLVQCIISYCIYFFVTQYNLCILDKYEINFIQLKKFCKHFIHPSIIGTRQMFYEQQFTSNI